jgi:hypothetical protein
MKDGRILGACPRKSYGLLHAHASRNLGKLMDHLR